GRRSGSRCTIHCSRTEEIRSRAAPKAALAGAEQNGYAPRGGAQDRSRQPCAQASLARPELLHIGAYRRGLPRTQFRGDEILGNRKGGMREARRFVVKVGSTLVTNRGAGLDASAIARWAAQVAKLRQAGKELVLVSSGAIAEGMQRLGWT